jgi:exopolyphosphatase / guanosine-5'-triphosphate,3'-diphosphate pyrophosphatase
MKASGRAVAKGESHAGVSRRHDAYAALDLGTNNCRLLIATREATGFRVIDSFSRTVRLGEGLGEANLLSDTAIRRAIDAVKVCVQKMRKADVTRSRAIATAACRTAKNGADCVARIKEETGVAFEIVSAGEEARLAVAGCAPLLDGACDGALVFDIGGGSTELVWVQLDGNRTPKIISWASAPIGVVNLAERHGGSRLPASAFPIMSQEALSIFKSVSPSVGVFGLGKNMHMLGTSGTVTTIAGIQLGLRRYDRSKIDGVWLDLHSALSVSDRLSSLDYDGRVAEPCVGTDRADLVLSGCAIFSAIAKLWPCERLRVADRGLREGILLALMSQQQKRSRSRRRRRRKRGRQIVPA